LILGAFGFLEGVLLGMVESPMQLADRVSEGVHGDGHPVASSSGRTCEDPQRSPAAQAMVRRAADPGRTLGEEGSVAASEGLSGVGATHVALTPADAGDQIQAKPLPQFL
jgi:hypothetical protein